MRTAGQKYRFWHFIVIILSVTGLLQVDSAKCAEIVDRIVAVVNNDIITLSDIESKMKPYADQIRKNRYSKEKEQSMLLSVREDMLQRLIDEKLTSQEAKQARISIIDEDVDAAIERIRSVRLQTGEDLKEALEAEGLTMEQYREQVKGRILRTRLVNLEVKSKIVITQEDIKDYFESHPEKYAGDIKYHLRNVIMRYHTDADENEKREIFKKMVAVVSTLETGERFESVAKKYSESALAEEGGDLGLFKIGALSPQLQKIIKDTDAGAYTPIIDTDQGYQIFYVEQIVETPGKTMESVENEIEEKLYRERVDKRFKTWLEDLRKQAHVKIIK